MGIVHQTPGRMRGQKHDVVNTHRPHTTVDVTARLICEPASASKHPSNPTSGYSRSSPRVPHPGSAACAEGGITLLPVALHCTKELSGPPPWWVHVSLGLRGESNRTSSCSTHAACIHVADEIEKGNPERSDEKYSRLVRFVETRPHKRGPSAPEAAFSDHRLA